MVEVTSLSSPTPGAEGIVVFQKDSDGLEKPLFSFVPPTGGMFIWARFYFISFPRFLALQSDTTCEDPEQAFEDEIWAKMASALVSPSSLLPK